MPVSGCAKCAEKAQGIMGALGDPKAGEIREGFLEEMHVS